MGTIVVLGAGAVGSLFGARFSAHGQPVLLVGRRAHVEAIQTRGLTVEGAGAGTYPLPAATELPPGLRADAVLLTVKTFDLVSAATELARTIPPAPTALLQNGLGVEEVVAETLRTYGWPRPEAALVRAVHTVPATLLGPGRVRASGAGEVVLPEPSSAGEAEAAATILLGRFEAAGFAVRTSPRLPFEAWRKAAVNAAVNPVTALRGVVNGALASGPAREEAERLLAEAVAVANAEGFDLPLATAEADLARVIEATSANRSSMWQDLERGRPTEVEAISGEVLRRGLARGLTLPATQQAVEAVRRAASERLRSGTGGGREGP